MPVSHIGLTVSHLPTSSSFFLSALQPLGYRYIGQQGNQIGLGIKDADFFLCQETPGIKAGAAHIAFTARDRAAVRDFYANALMAGGRPNGAPAERNAEHGYFNAAVLDFDGNSIEVVHRNEPDLRDDGTVIEHSRVLTWQREVSESIRDDRSIASSVKSRGTSRPLEFPAPSVASSKASTVKAPSVASSPTAVRSVSAPVVPAQTAVQPAQSTMSSSGDSAAKKIIGTLLGAAAGAAVAYAMVKSEEDSAKKEAEYNAMVQARSQAPTQTKALPAQSQGVIRDSDSQPKLALQDPQPIYEAPPKSVHRNISTTESIYSTTSRGQFPQKAIENVHRNFSTTESYYSTPHREPRKVIEAAPARTYYSSLPPTEVPVRRQIEYKPPTASTVIPARSQYGTHRSVSSPESVYTLKSKSHVPPAPSTLISSFVPDEDTRPTADRRSSAGSLHSHRSSKSKARSEARSESRSEAKSSHSRASRHETHVSKHTSASRNSSHHSSKPRSEAHSHTSSPSKPVSIVGSILGRDASVHHEPEDLIDDLEIEELRDSDTVAPSDSISNAGSSRRSHHSHRSKSRSGASTISSASKHSKHSHRSESRSHHSESRSHSHHSDAKSRHSSSSRKSRHSDYIDANEEMLSARSAIISEPSDASTVKPVKSSTGSSSKGKERKDSLMEGGGGSGTVVSLPVRGITESMIGETREGKKGGRSVVSYAMGQ